MQAGIEVHRTLGPGFLEATYESALCVELKDRGIPFERQAPFDVTFKGEPVGQGRLDILVARKLVLELKSVDDLLPVHFAQVRAYLAATGLNLGLLMNFNVPVLLRGTRRIVRTHESLRPPGAPLPPGVLA